MTIATVKCFNDIKDFGFIQPEDGGKDVFVHISAVECAGMQGLTGGQKVSYEKETNRRSGKQSAGQLQAASEDEALTVVRRAMKADAIVEPTGVRLSQQTASALNLEAGLARAL